MITVLHVDDEPALMDVTKHFLERDSTICVTTTTSVRDAIETLKSSTFDAIISDYEMPEQDGIEFLKIVREGGNDTPFIIFTGRGREQAVIEALNNGADFYLQKGGDPQSQFAELKNMVRQLVQRKQVEHALKASEERYRAVVESQTELISRFLPDGTHVFANEAFCRYYGSSYADLIGKPFFPHVPKEERSLIRDHFASLTPEKPFGTIEHRVILVNGEIRWQQWSDRAIFDPAGVPVEYQSVGRDITDRKRAEEALIESENKFKVLTEKSLVGIYITSITKDNLLTYVNPRFAEIFGYTVNELNEKKTLFELVLPEDRSLFNEAFNSRLSAEMDSIQYEFRGIKKKGEIITVEVYGSLTHIQGSKGVIGTLVEITDRKNMEISLKEKVNYVQALMDTIPAPVFYRDTKGVYHDCNKAFEELVDLKKDEIVGKTIWDFFPKTQADHYKQKDDLIIANPHIQRYEYEITDSKGKRYDVMFSKTALFSANGSIAGIVGVIMDISERKEMEVSLKEKVNYVQALMDTIPAPVFYRDTAGTYHDCNRAFEELVSLKKNEIVGKTIWNFFPDTLANHYKMMDDLIVKNPYIQRYEYQITDSKGARYDVLFSKTALFSADGSIAGIVGVIMDISERKEMEVSLKEKVNYVQALMDTIPAPVFYRDTSGTYHDCNKAFEELVGMKKEEIIGKTIWDFFPKEYADTYKVKDDLIVANPHIQRYEFAITDVQGSVHEVMFSKTALFRADGSIGGIVGVILDISNRKKMEVSLKEKVNYVQALMDTIPAPVFYRDTSGTYHDCNKAFEELVSLKRDEIIGKTIWDFFPETLADHYKMMDDLIVKNPYIQRYEHQITDSKGAGYDVLFSKTALFSADGSIAGIVGVIMDISERKEMEQVLRDNEEKYRTLADFTYDWESWLGENGAYVYVSPSCERITGYRAEEFIADPGLVEKITHPSDRDLVSRHYREYPTKPDVFHMDFRIITKSGNLCWISHYCQPVYRADGTWLGRRENKRDISHRKRVEEALQQANRKLNLLSSVTRHDVLNQLTVLIGYLELLKETDNQGNFNDLMIKVELAAETIRHQISFTRDYQDIGVHSPTWQDIEKIIRHATEGKNLGDIKTVIKLDGMQVYADPLLEKVFYNLVDNAARHGKTVTEISFSLDETPQGQKIICEDNGAGIPKDEKMRIFERGYGKNTGYGLFLTREILGITGLSIEETGEPGRGSRFEIFLPAGTYRVTPSHVA
jgi:PAS domain S-box-containing protein